MEDLFHIVGMVIRSLQVPTSPYEKLQQRFIVYNNNIVYDRILSTHNQDCDKLASSWICIPIKYEMD